MEDHALYMKRCIQLAGQGIGTVAPNPMVGSLLVYNNRIIGEGFHQAYGDAHAEVNCINSVASPDKAYIPASTLYVSLEPCNHFGNTPPCTDFIIEQGIKKVVVACTDPFAKVNGTGIEKLRNAGVEVIEGVLEEEAKELNKRFFTFHREQRPYIILKWAETADGFIGSGTSERLKITSETTDILVHKWRSEEAAILVGTNTAMLDDPGLTNRLYSGKNPVRVVVDLDLKVPAANKLLSDGNPVIIINSLKSGEEGAITYYKVGRDENMIAVIISLLLQRKLTSLLVEGGAKFLSAFITAGVWDEARVIINEKMQVYNGLPAPGLSNSKLTDTITLDGHNIRISKYHPGH